MIGWAAARSAARSCGPLGSWRTVRASGINPRRGAEPPRDLKRNVVDVSNEGAVDEEVAGRRKTGRELSCASERARVEVR